MLRGTERILFAITLLLAVMAGYWVGRLTAPERIKELYTTSAGCTDLRETREKENYQFINPLLECDNYQASKLNSVVALETDVQSVILKAKNENKASFVSVYFRDLNTGRWIGINEHENFSPASLLKVPILIAAFKRSENDAAYLKTKVKYTKKLQNTVSPNIVEPNLIVLGRTYTVEDLLRTMIEFSDNDAKELILQTLDPIFVEKVMADIGIKVIPGDTPDFVSVKDYSSFFRLLYNATYLDRNLSEKALQILSKTRYSKGLLAGLPSGITVAHKFGERAYTNVNIKQLHECGIVYAEGAPYEICVMTRGTDFDQLASVIADISALVYKDVQLAK